MRNLVLCCDGTSNEYSDQNTNVVKIFTMLRRDPARQLCFYDPGVGTFSAPAVFSRTAKFLTRVMGLAFGLGITQNIEDAYEFIMSEWAPGDRIFIFGFSRGAYTARAVAAMLHKVGLLDRGSVNLVPYASRMFKHERREAVWRGFAKAFGSGGGFPVYFIGLWDTVTSVGWVYDPFTLPYTMNNPSVKIVRHAISIDEHRAFFRQNLWGAGSEGQDVRQVWFAGDHCDVGGSHPERESGLSQIALEWMVQQAEAAGLLIDQNVKARVLPKPGDPRGAQPPGAPPAAQPPDYRGPAHESLKWYWWPAEVWPKEFHDPADNFATKLRMNLGRRRFMREGAAIHESVVMKMRDDPTYRPPNLPTDYKVEPWANRTG
jgi:uncharacterized protein (DUF2235 family)